MTLQRTYPNYEMIQLIAVSDVSQNQRKFCEKQNFKKKFVVANVHKNANIIGHSN